MKPTTRAQYAARLEPALQWLARHPQASPDLHQLADLAHQGDYQRIGERFDRLAMLAVGQGLLGEVPGPWIGVYYDDPQQVAAERHALACGRGAGDRAGHRADRP